MSHFSIQFSESTWGGERSPGQDPDDRWPNYEPSYRDVPSILIQRRRLPAGTFDVSGNLPMNKSSVTCSQINQHSW